MNLIPSASHSRSDNRCAPVDPSTQLSAILDAPNADEQLRDLARLVSERGVVFFKAQDIKIADQLKLVDRLGKLSGKPESSGLHIHPISESTPEFGPEVSVISSMGACLYLRSVWRTCMRSRS